MFWKPLSATDVAAYVISYLAKTKRRIDHLKLQKILYYLQGHFAAAFHGYPLFSDGIEAWPYGPVVPSVYRIYCANGSLLIQSRGEYTLSVDSSVLAIIHRVIEDKVVLSDSQLVAATKAEAPWKLHAKEALAGLKPAIRFSDIVSFFAERSKSMSGGYFDYQDLTLANAIFDDDKHPHDVFEDVEITNIVHDVFDLIHALDWYKSGDTSQEDYLKAKNEFKHKWLCQPTQRTQRIVDTAVTQLKRELYQTFDLPQSEAEHE